MAIASSNADLAALTPDMVFAVIPVSPVGSAFWEGHGLLDSPLLSLSPFNTPERLSSPLHGLTAAGVDGSIDAAGLLGLFGQSPISCADPGSCLAVTPNTLRLTASPLANEVCRQSTLYTCVHQSVLSVRIFGGCFSTHLLGRTVKGSGFTLTLTAIVPTAQANLLNMHLTVCRCMS